jgi:Leucine-rich repeat (LRR) protein
MNRLIQLTLMTLAWLSCTLALGQNRRSVIENAPADLVWFDNLDEAVVAQSQGTVVLALDATKSKWKEVPLALLELKDLRYLMLNRNKLESLPDWMSDMKDLRAVVADHNRFERFPRVVLDMPQLTQISLGENYIEAIPLDIDQITKLQYLSLWGNVIGSFPASLGDLRELKALDLLHNEMSEGEQMELREWLPGVLLNMSEPCQCDFDNP